MKNIEKALTYLKKKDAKLAKVINKIGVIQVDVQRPQFSTLVRSIVSQQLSGRVAKVIYDRLEFLCKKNVSPKKILSLSKKQLRSIGLSERKSEYIHDLAFHFDSKKISIEKLQQLHKEEIIELLTQVKGIGPWTAEMFLMFSLGHEDIFSVRDLGLRNAVITLYNLEKNTSNEDIEKIADKWSPYRSVASLYLWKFNTEKEVDW